MNKLLARKNFTRRNIAVLTAIAVVAVTMISMQAIIPYGHDVLAKKHHNKGHHHVNPHHNNGKHKGFTKGFYTKKGHHHCLKGTKGCTLHGK